jgi:hypothetical protein
MPNKIFQCDTACLMITQSTALMVALVIGVTALVFLSYPFGAQAYVPSKTTHIVSDDLERLRAGAMEQTKAAKAGNSVWKPGNSRQLDSAIKGIRAATNEKELFASAMLIPGQVQGFHSLQPISSANLPSMMGWNFDYSSVGWFWCVGSFQSPVPSSFSFSVIRLDLASPRAREKLAHGPGRGEQTLYFVSCGFGRVGRHWHRSPYTVVRGEYRHALKPKNAFTFQSVDDTLQMSSTGPGHFAFDFQFNGTSRMVATLTNMGAPQPAQINAGAPLIGGIGSSYWSYVRSICNAEMTFGPGDKQALVGSAWLDRQIVRTERPTTGFVSLALNTRNFSRGGNYGLGRYIWMMIQLNDGTSYMVWTTNLTTGDATWEIDIGTVMHANYNIYYENGTIDYNRRTVLRVTAYQSVHYKGECIRMPTTLTFSVHMPSGNRGDLAVNGRMFQNAWTLDPSNMPHWSGGMMVYQGIHSPSDPRPPLGTGTLEISGMGTNAVTTKAMLEAANMDEQDQSLFINGRQLDSTAQAENALLMLVLSVILCYIIAQWIALTCQHFYRPTMPATATASNSSGQQVLQA